MEITPKPATAAFLDFHIYTFKAYAEYFEQIKSQESQLIMPQLAKKRPPNGTSLFVIARHESPQLYL